MPAKPVIAELKHGMQLALPLQESIASQASPTPIHESSTPTATNETPPDYQLVRSKRRTLSINIQQGKVIVRAPIRATRSMVQAFVDEKSRWINTQIAVQRLQLTETLQIANGSAFNLFGESCQIKIQAEANMRTRKRSRVHFIDNQLHITAAISADASQSPDAQYQQLFRRWLKSQAPVYMNSNTQALARRMGLAPNLGAINYRYTTSKWGHCTSAGDIQYNPSIALAPMHVVDYIIAHEVCHLRHRNHSKRYWKLVASVCPHWQQAEAWLDNDGHRISIGNCG